MSIMVEADPRFPDARAAAVIIEQLNKMMPVADLDHEPLLEEAKQLEEQIRSMMEGAEGSSAPHQLRCCTADLRKSPIQMLEW